jgi:hypothetical protein
MSEQQAPQEMPSFELQDLAFESDEQFEQEDSSKRARFFDKPGQYDLEIVEAEYVGPSKKDGQWGNIRVVLKGAGDREVSDYILIPLAGDGKYGANRTTFPMRKLKKFTTAIGKPLTVDKTLPKQLETIFRPTTKLVGKKVKADVGYTSGYIRYAGKLEDGTKRYELVMKDGNVVSEGGQPKHFPDVDAAKAYAATNKIEFQKYIQVNEYHSAAQQVSNSNW